MNIKHLSRAGAVAVVTACTSAPGPQETDRLTQEIMRYSFREQGIGAVASRPRCQCGPACAATSAPG
jgi:hypothetical protein